MTELEALAKDCIENHTHKLVGRPTKQDIYLREESIFIQGYRQSEKKIEELEQQIEKYIEGNKKLQKVIYENTIYIGKLKEQIEKMKCCQNCADGKSCKNSGLVYVCNKWR